MITSGGGRGNGSLANPRFMDDLSMNQPSFVIFQLPTFDFQKVHTLLQHSPRHPASRHDESMKPPQGILLAALLTDAEDYGEA